MFWRERERILLVSSPIKCQVRGSDREHGTFIQGIGRIPYRTPIDECRLCELGSTTSLTKFPRTPARMGQGTDTCTDRPTEVSVIRFVSRNRTIEEIAPKKVKPPEPFNEFNDP